MCYFCVCFCPVNVTIINTKLVLICWKLFEPLYRLFIIFMFTFMWHCKLPNIYCDLSQSLPSEAMSSAALFNCLYLEISASLDHRTPELLGCVVRLARGQSPWPPGTSAEDMSGDGQRESITSRAKRFLSSLVPRYPRDREVGKFLRQKSRSCHDLGALWLCISLIICL